jgi:Glycosyl transferase family 2
MPPPGGLGISFTMPPRTPIRRSKGRPAAIDSLAGRPENSRNIEIDALALATALRATARHMRGAWPDLSGEASDTAAAFGNIEIAVIIPCFNESATIAAVIADFRAALPTARICVFDNNSPDDTAQIARAAGAEVHRELRPGKGNVVRRMFADIDADVYVMADGDGTYDVASAGKLVSKIVFERFDMAVGARANVQSDAHRKGHAIGNKLFNGLYAALFGAQYCDIFSGYRAFSRRFVKSFPALSSGFEIETELSVHASQLKLPTTEIILPYGKRPEGSTSKLHTVRDGWRILTAFVFLLKETRPGLFFGAPAAALALLSTALALPLAQTFIETGLVPRLPTAILCTGIAMTAALMMVAGLILDSLARARVEQKRILYLAVNAFKF